MRENEMDACLLANGVNIYYTTGKMYNGYFYLPVEDEPCFFVKRPGGYAGDRIRYIRKPEEIAGHLETLGMPKPARLMLEADELIAGLRHHGRSASCVFLPVATRRFMRRSRIAIVRA